MSDDLKVRRSQTISPFTVGAILDLMGHSLVATDIRYWRRDQFIPIPAQRLAGLLGIDAVYMPPPVPSDFGSSRPSDGIPFARFPKWVFCPSCRRMRHLRDNGTADLPRCRSCSAGRGTAMTPMRFVRVCGHGHLEDIDWHWWAHREPSTSDQSQCHRQDLLAFVTAANRGGGLGSLSVQCDACDATHDLEDLPRMRLKCRGAQPWLQPDEFETCPDGNAKAVQRGATSVHFPHIRSAIDIPPFSSWSFTSDEAVELRNNEVFMSVCRRSYKPDDPKLEGLIDLIASETSLDHKDILVALEREWSRSDEIVQPIPTPTDEVHLRSQEWNALRSHRPGQDPRDHLLAHVVPQHDVDEAMAVVGMPTAPIRPLVQVEKLREVRVLEGFSRFDRLSEVPPDLARHGRLGVRWRPGIEVFGEGILIGLDPARLREWEQGQAVRRRAARIEGHRAQSPVASRLPEATPRLVLIHTLSHLIMRELALVAGYGSASLRERLYADVDADMQGVLVYTADGDSEGSLGGLVRQGEPAYFARLMAQALLRARWCSLDPVCGEVTSQGTDSLSIAACHACALVPETSCEAMNGLLDRALAIDDAIGYFAPEVKALEQLTGEPV
jgi:hypothetical protein